MTYKFKPQLKDKTVQIKLTKWTLLTDIEHNKKEAQHSWLHKKISKALVGYQELILEEKTK